MEWGCFALAPSIPTSFVNPGTLVSKQFLKNYSKSSPTSTTFCFYPLYNKISRSSTLFKASNTSFFTRSPTINSNWNDGSTISVDSRPSWLPRFEELDPTEMLLRQRIIFLGSQVDDFTADFVIGQLLFLDAEDPKKDIKLFINSPGGSITAAMGIYDAMKLCRADISTICMGIAASMGAFILATGTKGKRFCMPNARVMLRDQKGNAEGTHMELLIQTREMMYQRVKLKKILSRVTGKPNEQIELDAQHDYFMNPWEAKEYGLVDEVIDDGKPGLVAPIADASPPPSPKRWFLWGSGHGKKMIKEDLPSEEKMLRNRNIAEVEEDSFSISFKTSW